MTTRLRIATRPWLCIVAILAASLVLPAWIAAGNELLDVSMAVSPQVVPSGDQVTYRIAVTNDASAPLEGATLSCALPQGCAYVPGSAQLRRNGVLVSTNDPVVDANVVTWDGVSIPPSRETAVYGLHSFCQDRCDSGYITYQLDRICEAMGAGAYVKQLLYRITESTAGPESCWVEFVNACYDRDLVPIVRLQGVHGGDNWNKPVASSPGDYGAIAQAFARVVAGLPRREGRLLYVEVWNEPNLNLEWSGGANATEYGEFLVDVASALRAIGDDRIVILNGGLSPGGDIAPLTFIDEMMAVPGALGAFDVWAVHPYPGNHPPEYNIHDGTAVTYQGLTIDSYLLELERLAGWGRSGVSVMLTETGYALGQNNFAFQGYPAINEANRADYITRALRDYWGRWPEVLGVCPFELVDPDGAWAVWDWLSPDGSSHQQYDAVRAMDKSALPAPGSLSIAFTVQVDASPGTYSSDVSLRLADGGQVEESGLATLNVQPPPPTATPTATPTSTPTPGPTECWDVIRDGGFETGAGWEIPDTAYPAGFTRGVVYEGERAARVGIADGDVVESWSSVRQGFWVPDNATSLRISFMYYPVTEDLDTGLQYALLLDEDKSYLETLMWTVSDAREWTQVVHDVSGYSGQTLWVHFGARNTSDAAGPTAMYVDDVCVEVCLPLGAVTATPEVTLPAGHTPTPTMGPQCLPLIYRGRTYTGTPTPPPLVTPTPEPDLPAHVSRTIQVCREPHGVAVDTETGLVYVASYVDPVLYVVDAVTGQVISDVDLGAVGGSNGVAVDSVRRRAYVANSLTDNVSVVDLDALSVTGTVDAGGRPLYAAVDASDGAVYVSNHGAGSVSVLAGDPPVETGTLTTGTEPMGLAVDSSRSRLAVVNNSELFDSLSLFVLDSAADAQTVPVGAGPYGVSLDPISGTWYTANARGASISVVDDSGHSLAEWSMPSRVYQVVYSTTTRRLYALCSDEDALYVIDPADGDVVLGLSVGSGSGHGVAIDPGSRCLYVTNAGDGTLSVIQEGAAAGSLGLPLIWRGESGHSAGVAVAGQASTEADRHTGQAISPEDTVVALGDGALSGVRADLAAYDAMRRRLVVVDGPAIKSVDAVTGRVLYRAASDEGVTALAIDPLSGWVWCAYGDRGMVRAFGLDGRLRCVVADLGYAADLTVENGVAYVADAVDNRVIAVDGATGRTFASESLPGAPYALAVDRARRRIYAGEMGTGCVLALDAVSLRVVDRVALGGLGYVHSLTLNASGTRLYATHDLSPKYGALSMIDTGEMKVVDRLTGDHQQPLTEPRGLLVLRDGTRAAMQLGDGFSLVSLDGLDVSSATRLSDGHALCGLALDPMSEVIVATDDTGRLRTYGLQTGTNGAVR